MNIERLGELEWKLVGAEDELNLLFKFFSDYAKAIRIARRESGVRIPDPLNLDSGYQSTIVRNGEQVELTIRLTTLDDPLTSAELRRMDEGRRSIQEN